MTRKLGLEEETISDATNERDAKDVLTSQLRDKTEKKQKRRRLNLHRASMQLHALNSLPRSQARLT